MSNEPTTTSDYPSRVDQEIYNETDRCYEDFDDDNAWRALILVIGFIAIVLFIVASILGPILTIPLGIFRVFKKDSKQTEEFYLIPTITSKGKVRWMYSEV